jgi:hypothetical protein
MGNILICKQKVFACQRIAEVAVVRESHKLFFESEGIWMKGLSST